jgi:hypothetical protein
MAINNDVTNTQLITIGLADDTVGHIIGKQFGGSAIYPGGWSPGNTFPQSSTSQAMYETFERTMLAANINGCDVCIRITFMFPSSGSAHPYRPDSFNVEWWIGDTQQTDAPFGN